MEVAAVSHHESTYGSVLPSLIIVCWGHTSIASVTINVIKQTFTSGSNKAESNIITVLPNTGANVGQRVVMMVLVVQPSLIIFPSVTTFRLIVGPTQHPIQKVLTNTLWVKWQQHEAMQTGLLT